VRATKNQSEQPGDSIAPLNQKSNELFFSNIHLLKAKSI
jgi:hypothetical protein